MHAPTALCQFFALTPIFAWPAGEKPAPCMEMLASHRLLLNNRFCEYFTGVILTLYILVMECFWGVYCEYPRSHLYTKKTKVTSGIFHGYAMRKGCYNYFIPCHRKYSDQMGRLVWYSWIMHWSMGRFGGILTNIQQLSCILIGCIFYGLV